MSSNFFGRSSGLKSESKLFDLKNISVTIKKIDQFMQIKKVKLNLNSHA